MLRFATYPVAMSAAILATPSQADWGAVAVKPGTYHWAYTVGKTSKAEASGRALQHCGAMAEGGPKCEVVLHTRQCGAIARGTVSAAPKFFVAAASKQDTAGEKAVAECKNASAKSCELRRSFCANDE